MSSSETEPERCIQCQRTAAELGPGDGHGKQLLTRPRHLLKNSEYQVCLECARAIHQEHAQRNYIDPSARQAHSRPVLAGIPKNVSPSREEGASPASSRHQAAEGDLFPGSAE